MNLQVGVKIALKNKENKFLLLERSSVKYQTNGSWDIVGGRINPGTPLIENLKREIFEETKLVLKEDPKLVAAQDILLPEKSIHVVRLTYTADIEGDPVLDEEHVQYMWLTRQEMLEHPDLDVYVMDLLKQGVL